MNQVSIQLPSDLFFEIYKKYGEFSQEKIIYVLELLIKEDIPLKLSDDAGVIIRKIDWPNPNTQGYKVWKISQELLDEDGKLNTKHKKLVTEKCKELGINPNTTNTNYTSWKKWHQSRAI